MKLNFKSFFAKKSVKLASIITASVLVVAAVTTTLVVTLTKKPAPDTENPTVYTTRELFDLVSDSLFAGKNLSEQNVVALFADVDASVNGEDYQIKVRGNLNRNALSESGLLFQFYNSAGVLTFGFYYINGKVYLDPGNGGTKIYLEDFDGTMPAELARNILNSVGDLSSVKLGEALSLDSVVDSLIDAVLGDSAIRIEGNKKYIEIQLKINDLIAIVKDVINTIDVDAMIETATGLHTNITGFLNDLEIPQINGILKAELTGEDLTSIELDLSAPDTNVVVAADVHIYDHSIDLELPEDISSFAPYSFTNIQFEMALDAQAQDFDLGKIINLIAGAGTVPEDVLMINGNLPLDIVVKADLSLNDSLKNLVLFEIYRGTGRSDKVLSAYFLHGSLYINLQNLAPSLINLPNLKIDVVDGIGGVLGMFTNMNAGSGLADLLNSTQLVNYSVSAGSSPARDMSLFVNKLASILGLSDNLYEENGKIGLTLDKNMLDLIYDLLPEGTIDFTNWGELSVVYDKAAKTLSLNVDLSEFGVGLDAVLSDINIGPAPQGLKDYLDSAVSQDTYISVLTSDGSINPDFVKKLAETLLNIDFETSFDLNVAPGSYNIGDLLGLFGVDQDVYLNLPQGIDAAATLTLKTKFDLYNGANTVIQVEFNYDDSGIGLYYLNNNLYLDLRNIGKPLNTVSVNTPVLKYEGLDLTAAINDFVDGLIPNNGGGGGGGEGGEGNGESSPSANLELLLSGLTLTGTGFTYNLTNAILVHILSLVGIEADLPEIGQIVLGYDDHLYLNYNYGEIISLSATLNEFSLGYAVPQVPEFVATYLTAGDVLLAILGNLDIEGSILLGAENADLAPIINSLVGSEIIPAGLFVLNGQVAYTFTLKAALDRRDNGLNKAAFEIFASGAFVGGVYLQGDTLYFRLSEVLRPYIDLPNLKYEGIDISSGLNNLLTRLDEYAPALSGYLENNKTPFEVGPGETSISLTADITALVTGLLGRDIGAVSATVDLSNTRFEISLDDISVALALDSVLFGYENGTPISFPGFAGYVNIIENGRISRELVNAVAETLFNIDLSATFRLDVEAGDYNVGSLLSLFGIDQAIDLHLENGIHGTATLAVKTKLDLTDPDNTAISVELDLGGTLVALYYYQGAFYLDLRGLYRVNNTTIINMPVLKYEGVDLTAYVNGLLNGLFAGNGGAAAKAAAEAKAKVPAIRRPISGFSSPA
jgi:hypothetical protein